MPRFSRTRLRLRASMSNKAIAYHLQRREVARGSREEIVDEKTKATTPPLPPTTITTPCSDDGASTSNLMSNPSTADPPHESSAALRKRLLESKLPIPTAVSHKKEIISSSTVDNMVKYIHCNICNGHCKVERQQQSADVEFTVECEICENIVYKYTKEKVEIEGYRESVGQTALLLVHHCMLYDLGYAGMQSLSSSLGIPLMSKGTYILHEKKSRRYSKNEV